MTSITFHSGGAETGAATSVARTATKSPQVKAAVAKPPRDPYDRGGLARRVLTPLAGMALLVGVWALLTQKGGTFPTPAATFEAAVKLFANPFYEQGPNDQGIGWNILF